MTAFDVDLKAEFERCLFQCYSVSDEVTEFEKLAPAEGRNSDGHFKVLAGGQLYGFKTYPEAERKGENHCKYAEQDRILAIIAKIVEAPNHSRIEQVDDIEATPFKSRLVNIIKWLPNSTRLDKLNDQAVEQLRNNGTKFFYEYGSWLAFAVAFGIQDRRVEQFVYSQRENRLAMIDMDYCFVQEPKNYESLKLSLSFLRPVKSQNFAAYIHELGRGIDEMNSKLETNSKNIMTKLQAAEHSSLSKTWNLAPDISLKARFETDIKNVIK